MITFNVYCDECYKAITTDAGSKAGAMKVVREHDFVAPDGKQLCAACAEKIGYLVKCPGEAHRNPYVDSCSVCAPRWGLVVA